MGIGTQETYGPASGYLSYPYLSPVGPAYAPGPEGDAQRAKDIAEKEAYMAREESLRRLDSAWKALTSFGTTEDIEAAAKAIAKIAAKAMRRRG